CLVGSEMCKSDRYITGWTNEPYTYLKTFDVALLLSRWWEGFGLAIVEYMAAEKNVVATRTYAIPTLVDDGIDGLLVKVDSPEDVCEKVVWLYNHSEEAAIMRKAALQKVYEKFDIQRVADQHVMMFETICYTKDKI
ncbi:MAG: glycosyltransferase family 4 protein, partial [Prevotella sp.]|nr:glycosyltransferase family 4 protein [Prevotella sp.]